MKKLATATGIGLTAATLIACGFLGKGKSGGEGIKYSDSSFGIELTLPGGWDKTSEETDSDGMTTVDFDKGNLEATVMYTEMPGLEDMGISEGDFLEMIMDEFAGTDETTLQTLKEGSIVVDGVSGKEKVIQGTIEGSEGIGRMIALFENDKMLIIMFVHEEADEFNSDDNKGMKEFLNGLNLDL